MSGMPKRAVVLAAGLGMRLRPLTLERPKPLMPLDGVSLLERTLRLLEGWGVEEIAVNLHWQPEKIRAYLNTRAGSARIETSFEPEILGTAGALRPLQTFLGNEPFWVVNADIAAVLDPEPMVKAFAEGDGLAAAWLEPEKGPRTVEADHQGRITCYRSPTPGVPGTYTFCGVQLVSSQIFSFLPDTPFCTLVEAYEQAMLQGVFVRGVVLQGSYWDDAGTVEAYLRIHRELETQNKLSPRWASAISDQAKVAPDVYLENSVIYGDAQVLPGSVLKHCVIAGGCVGGKLDQVVCVPASAIAEEGVAGAVAAMKWDLAGTAACFLEARGSNRRFWRLYNGRETAISIHYSEERLENKRYAGHARLLTEARVPVPAVLADLPEQGVLVLDDWGEDSLQQRMARQPNRAWAWYRPVVAALARLHDAGTRLVLAQQTVLEPPFDPPLYAWEHALFARHLLSERYGIERLPTAVSAELQTVADRLVASRQVVIHRDLQSSNILFRARKFVFIDFQGMRFGAAAYDLASLLYDPYVKLSAYLRKDLLEYYGCLLPKDTDAVLLFHEGAVQRLIQALGAFGRLTAVGQSGFIQYILPALENLLEAADLIGLDALGGLAEELIAREQSRTGV